MQLTEMKAAELVAGIAARKFSAVEVAQAFLDRTEKLKHLNVYVHLEPEVVLDQAKAVDKRIAAGENPGPLGGLPVAIKDLLCVKGEPTTCGSRMLKNFRPPYDATVIEKLKAAGAVLYGKANMDEFAMGSSTENSCYGPTLNPWDTKRIPGGSSGGSAAAVAAMTAPVSLGSDTGGSIRQPAAFTGIVGIKPTYGRCSRWGIVAFASSLDQAGPIAKTVEDSAMLLQSMAGHDPKDSTSLTNALPDFRAATKRSIKGMRIGVPEEYRVDGMPAEIEALWQQGIEWVKAAGATIVPISLKHTKYALPAYYIVAPAEASSNLARYDGMRYGARVAGKDLNSTYENTRASGFGKEVQRRILIGTYVLSAGYYDAYYLRAQKVRQRIAQDFRDAFEKVDAILTPATPSAAFALGEKSGDPLAMYLNDIFTVTANLAGLPALALPAATDAQGLPLGLQVIGKALDEESVFAVSAELERAANFRAKAAKWWL